ncbi:MAG: 2-phosphosulfolactate phosphatase [Candidatus Rokubacteria bacterium]|nr:2-phosphosulfolactate phosphatase [Candidatus Rokubacteria bacterium]
MRVHVVLTPAELGVDLQARTAVVIDVFRAATTIVTALANGCRAIVPTLTPEDARERARQFPRGEVLLAGERGGDPIDGFDLGNSPPEYTAPRVAGKTVVLTTTNGTKALLRASGAAVTAVAGLVNVKGVAQWAREQGRDLTLACAGEAGAASLEDTVCAGLIIDALAGAGAVEPSDAAAMAWGAARDYRHRLDDLRSESHWGRHLARRGRQADLAACLAVDAWTAVPLLQGGCVTAGRP